MGCPVSIQRMSVHTQAPVPGTADQKPLTGISYPVDCHQSTGDPPNLILQGSKCNR